MKVFFRSKRSDPARKNLFNKASGCSRYNKYYSCKYSILYSLKGNPFERSLSDSHLNYEKSKVPFTCGWSDTPDKLLPVPISRADQAKKQIISFSAEKRILIYYSTKSIYFLYISFSRPHCHSKLVHSILLSTKYLVSVSYIASRPSLIFIVSHDRKQFFCFLCYWKADDGIVFAMSL